MSDAPPIDWDLVTPEDMSEELTRRGVAHLMIIESPGNESGQSFKAKIFTNGCIHKKRSLFRALADFIKKHWTQP